jgi:F-type H+-transporting ATPase subunit b
MFELNPGLGVWTTVIFVLLILVLGRFGWKPLLRTLQEREDKIRDALDQAEKARADASELLKQNEINRSRAEEEYRKIVRDARTMAEKMKDEIVAKARQQAQREIDVAKDEIGRNLESAKQELRGEVADLAVQIAAKILDESIDRSKHSKIIDEYLKRLPEN